MGLEPQICVREGGTENFDRTSYAKFCSNKLSLRYRGISDLPDLGDGMTDCAHTISFVSSLSV